jgi:6-phosphogluconolactonase (cycloisomerase 2 family)
MLTRRSLLKALPGIALVPRSFSAMAAHPRYKLFIGTGTGHPGNSKGIYVADWNSSELGEISLAAEMNNPTFIATDSRFRHLYAVSEAAEGQAVAFDIKENGATLALTRLNEQRTQGSGPAHVAVSPNGRAVFATNYGSGSLTTYTILPTGELSAPVSHFQYKPIDDRPEHQHPHAHEATPSPDGNWLLVNDLGSDRIYIYRANPESGQLTPGAHAFWQDRFQSGPRHLAFHPNGRWVYNANELDSTVDHLLWNSTEGTLVTQGSYVSTLPPRYPSGQSTASEILVSPDGNWLYVGNRGPETIARFAIHPRTGQLELVQLAPHGGKTARHITLDPTARFLLVACQDSGTIVVMGRDPASGRLSKPLRSYPIDSPQCLVFVA